MKAMVIERFGGPEVFAATEIPRPVVRPSHVLIRVAASSVNPIDLKVRSGAVPALAPSFPAVLHGDVAGVVEEVGAGVSGLRAGDEVFGCAGGFRGLDGGALAEFMLADAALLARRPAALGPLEAAALALVGITAWEALVERANLRAGQRVLVHAGAGGVGHVAVQIARLCGAQVFATVSTPEKARVARELGADEAILYGATPVKDYVAACTGGEGFDVVFDTVGGANLAASFEAARLGGTVVTIAARSTQDLSPLHARGLTLHVVFMLLPLLTGRDRARHGDILARLARLADAGRLKVRLDGGVFDFGNVAAAHARLEAGHITGKIALRCAF